MAARSHCTLTPPRPRRAGTRATGARIPHRGCRKTRAARPRYLRSLSLVPARCSTAPFPRNSGIMEHMLSRFSPGLLGSFTLALLALFGLTTLAQTPAESARERTSLAERYAIERLSLW